MQAATTVPGLGGPLPQWFPNIPTSSPGPFGLQAPSVVAQPREPMSIINLAVVLSIYPIGSVSLENSDSHTRTLLPHLELLGNPRGVESA